MITKHSNKTFDKLTFCKYIYYKDNKIQLSLFEAAVPNMYSKKEHYSTININFLC